MKKCHVLFKWPLKQCFPKTGFLENPFIVIFYSVQLIYLNIFHSSRKLQSKDKEERVKLMIDEAAATELEALRVKYKSMVDENNSLSIKVNILRAAFTLYSVFRSFTLITFYLCNTKFLSKEYGRNSCSSNVGEIGLKRTFLLQCCTAA